MQKVIDFAKEIKQIDPNLEVKTPAGADDISHVYYKGVPLYVTLPPIQGYIMDNPLKSHCDKNGYPFRTKSKALKDIKNRLKTYNQLKRDQLMGDVKV